MTPARGPVRFAIIGPGKGADLHARALAALPDAELVAVVGRDVGHARRFAAAHATRSFGSVEEARSSVGAEALIVCTPHPHHATHALAGIGSGLHVLVEKPMALTTADVDRMIEAAKGRGVILGAVAQRRWYPTARRVKDALAAGKIGEPALGEVEVLGWRDAAYYAMDPWRGTWKGEGGGVLVNQAIHQIDLLVWFLGPVAEVYARWDNFNHPGIAVEDSAVGLVRFASGALGSIVASNSQRPGLHARVHVHGRSGASVGVQTDSGSTFVAGVTTHVEPAINDLWTVPGEEDLPARWHIEDARAGADPLVDYHRLQLADFAAAARSGGTPAVSGEDARLTVELLEALYRSQELAGPVRLRPGAQPRVARPSAMAHTS